MLVQLAPAAQGKMKHTSSKAQGKERSFQSELLWFKAYHLLDVIVSKMLQILTDV